jgi:hypothetical protein
VQYTGPRFTLQSLVEVLRYLKIKNKKQKIKNKTKQNVAYSILGAKLRDLFVGKGFCKQFYFFNENNKQVLKLILEDLYK